MPKYGNLTRLSVFLEKIQRDMHHIVLLCNKLNNYTLRMHKKLELGPQIAQQFRDLYFEGDWVAKGLKTQLKDVDFNEATTSLGTHNTIAVLVFHIHYYISGVYQVLQGGALDIKDKYSFDIPELRDESDWKAMCQKVFEEGELFARAVENISDEDLVAPFVDPKYGNNYRNIHAMLQHVSYHLGQIGILKKLIRSSR